MTLHCFTFIVIFVAKIIIAVYCQTSSEGKQCEVSDESLMLTPLLDRNETLKARSLSEVRYQYLENFINQSYSGYLTVDRQLGNHLFFWLFVSTSNASAPLLLWLNGGPTISSMLGLFHEHGPMEIDRNKKQAPFSYYKRQHSWADHFSMLYVDNPVNTGFSFSDSGEKGDRFDEKGITQDLYNFMLQFLIIFPEYKFGEIYLGGQSYAGTYITSLTHYIHEQNKRRNNEDFIPISGIYLGGPYFDAQNQLEQHAEFMYQVGVHSYQDYINHKNSIIHTIKLRPNLTLQESVNISVEEIFSNFFTQSSKDNFATQEGPPYLIIKELMNTAYIRHAVHAGLTQEYKMYNFKLRNKFSYDALQSRLIKLSVLLDNYKVLIYNGDLDAIVSSGMIEESLLRAPWSLNKTYKSAKRKLWYKIGDSRKILAYYSLTGQFCRVVVSGAGHQTPYDKPETMLNVIKQFVTYGCINPKSDLGEV